MADGKITFGVDFADGEKKVSAFEKRVDDIAEKIEAPHSMDVDTAPAEKSLSKLADLATTAFSFEAAGKLGDFLGGIEERGKELNDTLRQVQAQTGLTAEGMADLQGRASTLFSAGAGESVAQMTKNLGIAQQQLGSLLDAPGIDAFTVKMAGIEKVFGVEFQETAEKTRTAVKAWGLEGEEAGNLVSLGLSKAVTPSNDFLDTLSEYSPLMKQAGFSAEDFTGRLIEGAEGGAFSLDKVADAAKETQIRLKAGDITSALKDIASPITATITGIVKAGEQGKKSVKEVMTESADAIETAFNEGKISEAVRSKLQVAISGTPAEDLGTELYGRIFSAPIDEETIKAQAMDAGTLMTNALAPQNVFEGIGRDIAALSEEAAGALTPFISGASGVLATAGQLGPAVTLISSNMGGIAKAASSAGSGLLAFATNPVTLAIAGVAALAVGISLLTDTQTEALQKQLEAGEASLQLVENQKKELAGTIKQTEATPKLAAEYERLGKKTNLTAAEQKRLTDVSNSLNKTYPGLIKNGASYGENLKAVTAQAGKTKDGLASLTKQMEDLNWKSKQIAEANRKIQAEILQENIVSSLASAQGGLAESIEQGFQSIFGSSSSAVKGLNAQTSAFFKALINAPSQAALDDMVKTFQTRLIELQKSEKIDKTSQQGINAMIIQLQSLLSKKWEVVATTAEKSGEKIGTDLGTGIVTAVRDNVKLDSEIAALLGEQFQKDVAAKYLAAVGVAKDATDVIRAQFERDQALSDEGFKQRRDALNAKFKDPKTGKTVAMTAAEKKQLAEALAAVNKLQKEFNEQLAAQQETAERAVRVNRIELERKASEAEGAARAKALQVGFQRQVLSDKTIEDYLSGKFAPVELFGFEKIGADAAASFGDAFAQGFAEIKPVDPSQLIEALKLLGTEEQQLRESLLRRETDQRTYNDKIADLARRRADIEQQLAGETEEVWKGVQTSAFTAFGAVIDSQTKTFGLTLQGFTGGTKQLEDVLVDFAGVTAGVVAQSALQSEEMAKFSAQKSLTILANTLEAQAAAIVALIIGKSFAEDPLLGAFVAAGATAAFIIAIEAAKSQIKNVHFRGGGYTGDGNPDEIAGFVHHKEYVLTEEETKLFLDIRENRYKYDRTADREFTRAAIQDMRRQQATTNTAIEQAHHVARLAIGRTEELAKEVREGQKKTTAAIGLVVNAISNGIPVRGRMVADGGALAGVMKTAFVKSRSGA